MVSMSQIMKQTQFRPFLILAGLFFIALAVRGIYFYELAKQIFGLSQEQNRHLYKIYRNMKVQLG